MRWPMLTPVLLACVAAHAAAQPLPVSQPKFLSIVVEEIPAGHAPAWERLAGERRAALERAGLAPTTLALRAVTGGDAAWFVSPAASMAEMGERRARPAGSPEAQGLLRIEAALATGLSARRTIEARARPELSHGAYPETAAQRFWEVSVLRVQPGHEEDVVAAFMSYGAAVDRAKLGLAWRVYEVLAGLPGSTYLVFTSVTTYGGFDAMIAADEAIVPSFTAENGMVFKRFQLAVTSSEVNRYRLDPALSTVPAEVRAADPGFWGR